jgi:hypothetical protein
MASFWAGKATGGSMGDTPDQLFQHILETARADPYVIGMCLGGSRGKGFEDEFSDYDICIVVADDTPEPMHERYKRLDGGSIDLWTITLSEFRMAAAWGGPTHWNRYSYAHVNALIDKLGGEIQQLIDAKGNIPDQQREPLLRGVLDAYINSLYRSLKCIRKGNLRGAQLEAHDSISYLLDILFAYEKRHRPYYGYLERELCIYPLTCIPLTSDQLLAKIDAIAASADRATQQELLAMVDALLRPGGFGDVFDSWGADYGWMHDFKG